MLLGRKTYESLAGYWPMQEGPWADMLNPLPKVVASSTLSEPLEWNAWLLEDELDGDVIVSGGGELARNLLAEGLVDELRFWVHPVVWGGGERPFQGEKVLVRLLESKEFDSGVTLLRHQPLAVG
jgi:dihydrofolate reductase